MTANWTEVLPWLLVGNFEARTASLGADVIVSLLTKSQQASVEHACPTNGTPVVRGLWDDDSVVAPEEIDNLLAHFGKRTLIHCLSGSNRSSCLALAALIRSGRDWVTAANLYYPARALTMAARAQGMPRMTVQMAANLEHWYERWRSSHGDR